MKFQASMPKRWINKTDQKKLDKPFVLYYGGNYSYTFSNGGKIPPQIGG
jgi:hypothetical protein